MNRLCRILSLGTIACAGLSASGASPSVTVITADWKTISFDVTGDNMFSVYTQPKDEPMALVLYTGNVEMDDNGKYHPSADNPGTIYLDMPLDNLEYMSFSGLSGVGDVAVSAKVNVDIDGGKMRVTQVESPVKISVWSAAGVAEAAFTITSDIEIDIARYGAGVHIVDIDGTTFKILTK